MLLVKPVYKDDKSFDYIDSFFFFLNNIVQVFIFDYTKHPSVPNPADNVCKPQLRLRGHTKEGIVSIFISLFFKFILTLVPFFRFHFIQHKAFLLRLWIIVESKLAWSFAFCFG